MTFGGAFSTSMQAMLAQSAGLNAISENIANMNTNGYKAAEVTFADTLSGTVQTSNAFSGPPSQLGVRATQRGLIDVQGILKPTQRWNDLAITGKGFFMVNDGSGKLSFTRDGSLNETSVPPATKGLVAGGGAAGASTYLTDINGNYLMGWVNGAEQTNSTRNLTAVNYALGETRAGAATTSLKLTGTLPPSSTGTTGSVNFTVYTGDGQARNVIMNMTPTAGTTNSWTYNFAIESTGGNTVVGPSGTLAFDGQGNVLNKPQTYNLGINWGDGASSSVNVDLSNIKQLAGGNFKLNGSNQDGYPPMNLTSVAFDTQGRLMGTYSPLSSPNTNGASAPVGSRTEVLYTVPLATFRAPGNMISKSGNLFDASLEAGAMTVSTVQKLGAQSGMVVGSVEGSNVNEERQFSDMIVTQQAYTLASKVFRTADEMTSTVSQLVV